MNILRSLPLFLCLALAFVARAAGKIVLGQLGQVQRPTPIYASPNTQSRVFATVKKSEYLVIRESGSSAWKQVLLQNGVFGYVPAQAVQILPYQVVSRQSGSRMSRGGSIPRIGAGAGSSVANYALNFIGTPYKWGGNDPYRGIDCSGFVKKMYGAIGVNLPRTAAEQVNVGTPITRLEDLRAGDRLYFSNKNHSKITHTGIYCGDGTFVHSSSGHHGVAREPLGVAKWLRILVAARRS